MLLTPPPRSFFNDIFVEVRKMAKDLLASHNLHDWTFAFNRRKQAMGLCVYGRRTVELSLYFVRRNTREEILDTILHEIAHALVGPGHGHDEVWKRKCIELGAKPIRCGNADMPKGRWLGVCNACGRQFHRHRKPKRVKGWFCVECGPELGKLVWRDQSAIGG